MANSEQIRVDLERLADSGLAHSKHAQELRAELQRLGREDES